MFTESQVVKQIARRHRGDLQVVHDVGWEAVRLMRGSDVRQPRLEAAKPQPKRRLPNPFRYYAWSPPISLTRRLRKRIMKKLRQPHRRKDRGPLRRRAAGKNEVRARRR